MYDVYSEALIIYLSLNSAIKGAYLQYFCVLTSLYVIPNVDVYQVKLTALYLFCWNILPLILLLKQTNTAHSDNNAFFPDIVKSPFHSFE